MRKSFLLILFVLFSLSTVYSQTVTLATYGVNPRAVAKDTNDVFDQTFNGLSNVGIQTKMYLKGSSSQDLTGATWTLVSKPATSTTTIGTSTPGDTKSQFMVFTPDVVGTYKVAFADAGKADTLTINAGKFLGMKGGSVSCVMCHSSVSTAYNKTAHAGTVKKQFDAMPGSSSHFGESCLECHTTGYNPNASNDGFDDFSFVFPASFGAGVYDATVTSYPDAMARANVQCEACHGPGSEHKGSTTDNKMVKSLDSETCASCHEDSGTHHYIPTQWEHAGHDATDFDGRGFHGGHAVGAFVSSTNRNGCSPCHSGAGYVQWDSEGKPTDADGLPAATAVRPTPTNISCATCHDPHDGTSIHQLRMSDTQLGDGTPVTFEKYGTGAQCMECHRSRREAATYASNPANGSAHYGPHHGPQADMLIGANYPDYGIALPSSPHAVAGGNACVDCHMSNEAGGFDSEGNVIVVGGHSFNMNDAEGNDNVKACAPCHGDVGTSFKEKKYFKNGMADHDGDGVAEGLQEEVHGMMETLLTYLPQKDGAIDMSAKTNSVAVMKAGYVYMWVEEDRSMGMHNPAFTVAMLQVAIESMKYGSITAGAIQSVQDIPMDQGYQVRLVWTAFGADDGVATDQVESYTILRQAPAGASNLDRSKYSSFKSITNVETGNLLDINGELWDVVANIPAIQYIEYSAVVPTLQNAVEGDTLLSTFKILGKTKSGIQAETTPMSGYSVDNLAPAVPGNLAATIGSNNTAVLTWDEPIDEDFNYFAVYRSESQGFIPSDENIIKTTTSNTFNDTEVILGKTYYYKVVAMDFSNNQSDLSVEVNLTITGIDDLENIPTAYSLNQNYPNPFNPSTTIKFGIPETSNVQITIYDMVGNKVAVLVNNNLTAGYHTYNWDASNRASGIYLVQMTTNKFTKTNKMLLIK